MFSRLVLKAVLALAGVGIEGKEDHDITVRDSRFVWRVLAGGSDRALGEAYMRGDFECRRLDLFIERLIKADLNRWIPDLHELKVWLMSRVVSQHNKQKSLRVAKHYNIPPWFYRLVLGPTMVYTSGVYGPGVITNDEAQQYKLDLFRRKIPNLGPGDTVLDVGFGWGGLMEHLARTTGCRAVGVSIAEEQVAFAQEKYARSNLPLEFRRCDYRDIEGRYDHIVSVCMSEHVGVANLPGYYRKMKSLLLPNGVFVWQGILASDRSARVSSFLDAHIFPGGELPTEGEMRAAVRGLFTILDRHYFPESYVKTLRAWSSNLEQHKDRVVAELGGEFYRMYQFYFNLCAAGFESGRVTVAQFVLSPASRPSYRPVR